MTDEKFHIVMAERAERAKKKTGDIHGRELAAMRERAEKAEAALAEAEMMYGLYVTIKHPKGTQ